MTPLLRELLRAHRLARRPEVAAALASCGIPVHDGGPIWGVDYVETSAHHYQPTPDGRPAVIVPLFDDGVLVDLVACGLSSRSCRTRKGICSVLGAEWLDRAKERGEPARIFLDPIAWLRHRRCGAVVIDWRTARYELRDLPGIAVDDELLARRIDDALRVPVAVPPIFVREARHAA